MIYECFYCGGKSTTLRQFRVCHPGGATRQEWICRSVRACDNRAAKKVGRDGGDVAVGLFKMSTSSYEEKPCRCKSKQNPDPPMPDPDNYAILNHEQHGAFLIILVQYYGCSNYEGKKILLYVDCTLEQLRSQKSIDPHFSSNTSYHSPIARFEPTARGMLMARLICKQWV